MFFALIFLVLGIVAAVYYKVTFTKEPGKITITWTVKGVVHTFNINL